MTNLDQHPWNGKKYTKSLGCFNKKSSALRGHSWRIEKSTVISDKWFMIFMAGLEIYIYIYSTWRYVDLGDSWRPHHHSKKKSQQLQPESSPNTAGRHHPGIICGCCDGAWFWVACASNFWELMISMSDQQNSDFDELLEGRQFWEPIRGSKIPQWQPDLTPWVTVPATWPVPGLRPHKTCALPWWNKKGFLKNWLFVVCVSFFLGFAFADAFAWHISWDVVDNLLPNPFSRINAVLC